VNKKGRERLKQGVNAMANATDTQGDGPVSRETCAAISTRVLESQSKLHEKLDLIERRLFKDNGTLSIQTRVDRHEQVIRAVLWALSGIGGVFLAALATGVVFILKTVFGGTA
jgi:hypothetical protein